MNSRQIVIPPIKLKWSHWFAWRDLTRDARSDPLGVIVPDKAGVYEAKLINSEKRLTIGRASNLRMRIKQALVKGKVPHSSGDEIRDQENISQVVIRWAVTERPAAVEEELHRRYIKRFGALPKHTDKT